MSNTITHLRKVDRIISTLLATSTITEAAEKLKMSRATLYTKYLNDPDFIAEFKRVRDERQRVVIGKLAEYGSRALDVLMEIAEDRKAPPHARVAAARGIVEQNGKVLDQIKAEELEERIARLEAEGEASWPNSNS